MVTFLLDFNTFEQFFCPPDDRIGVLTNRRRHEREGKQKR